MLYEPTRFDALIDEPWVPARVEDAIAAIVADADVAFDPKALWPAHEWDAREKPLPLSGLYVGAAGVIWALDELQERGRAESSRDLAAAVVRAVEFERAKPDFAADEHYRPGALISGETGALLVAFRLTCDPALADDVYALVRGNVDNPTDDISWGAPGTLLAAWAMGEWTGERRWDRAASESASALRERRGGDGLWRQDDDYRGLSTLHGVAGNTLALLRFEPDDAVASESAAVLSQRAGAHGDEKGHGLCHGTSGNGFALLKAFARTGDERWLERARRFAVHALAQAERMATANGRRRYSLFTGDVGTALFAAACLDADARFPIVDVI
jgi:hypothetical protein